MKTTGIGSMPGKDFREATRMVVDLGNDLLAWPEVPERDECSSMVGRTAGLLEQACNLTRDGWRLAGRPDSAQRRAARWWSNDLDDFEELTQGFEGTVKVALTGPWTLASQLRLGHPTMNHVLADRGACRDLAQALAAGVVDLTTGLRARMPHPVIVQVDEPGAAAVLAGDLPTFSGLERYRTPDADEVLAAWRELIVAVQAVPGIAQVWLHSCAPGLDPDLLMRAGFDGLAVESRHLDLDVAGDWLDAGRTLALGVVRTDQPQVPGVDEITRSALEPLRRLGVDPVTAADRVVLTPACGLAGWSMRDAAAILDRLGQASGLVAEQLQGSAT